jgi:uridine nucleosidase
MLAATHPSLHLLGISTGTCNQSVDKTTDNALAVLHAIGCRVPVYRGQAKPLMRDAPLCAKIHGDTGASTGVTPSQVTSATRTNRARLRVGS